MSSSESDSKQYTQKIWWHNDGLNKTFPLPDYGYHDFFYTYEVMSGDLVVNTLEPDFYTENGEEKCNGLKITFSGNKGVIEITAAQYGTYDGNTYICKYVLSYAGGSKKWDFNTKPIDAEYSHYGGADRNFSDQLSNFSEVSKKNHFYYHPYTRSEVLSYLLDELKTGTTTMDVLKSRNFTGTNYFGVKEAEGLYFLFYNYNCGYNNGRYWPGDNPVDKGANVIHPDGNQDKDENCYTRFLALKAGSVLIIP